jgi:hypothetical protein
MKNTLEHKPVYTIHRSLVGAPVAPDNANLQTLYELPGNSRAGLNCRRWKTVRVFVSITGGTTIDLQPLEVVAGEGAFPGAADEDRGFGISQAVIAGLSDGDFTDITINGGMLYLRVHAVAGATTALSLFVAGHEVAVSRTGQE